MKSFLWLYTNYNIKLIVFFRNVIQEQNYKKSY